jgi:ADP-ribose pyrophosphatase
VEFAVPKWKRTATRVVYENPYVRAHEDILRTPRGATFTSFRVDSPSYAIVVAVTEAGSILFVRNYRPAVTAYVLELPGGRIEPGEPPVRTARRELEEETGYRGRALVELGWFYPSPARMMSVGRVFLARRVTAGRRHLDVTEDMQTVEVPVERAYRELRAGKFHDANTMTGLALAEPYLRGPSRTVRSKPLIPRVAGRLRSGVG